MALYDLIAEAQGGRGIANLAGQFGLSEQQAADAIRSLLPALSRGLKRNSDTRDGLGALLGALEDGHHARYHDDADVLADPSVRRDGNDILGHVLGSKDVSRVVAERAAEQTGIGADILKQMLPYVAAMVMGALHKNGQNPLESILGQVLGRGQSQSKDGNPFGSLADILRGGGESRQGRSAPEKGTDVWGSDLDADDDGSVVDDVLDMLFGGRD